MQIITAVQNTLVQNDNVTLFLAGGITNCRQWQKELINMFKNYQSQHGQLNLTIFNPRRQNFPIDDPNASFEQIKWQFEYIQKSDIFSMFFCGDTNSSQPICFYQLGKQLGLRKNNNFNNIVITAEPQFSRYEDVVIQTQLISNNGLNVFNNLNEHFKQIINVYKMVFQEKLNQLW